MKTLIRISCIVALVTLIVSPVSAGSFNVKIIPPSQYEDNTPLPDNEIAGYRLYYGTVSGNYNTVKDVGKTTLLTVSGVPAGKYFIVATCLSIAGKESKYSNEIIKIVEAVAPKPPSCE